MHYDSIKNDHGLPHDPFKALVAPRPIGWISTISADGICNLAPYSFFNAIADRPHYVMFSSSSLKDSARNVQETGEFTCSLATFDLRTKMNLSSAAVPPDADEFDIAGLTASKSRFVAPPRVKQSPAAFECKHWRTIELPDVDAGEGNGHYLVIGRVVGIYIDDRFLKDGIVDTGAMRPIARMGYMDYAVVTPETVFTLHRPLVAEDGAVANPEPDAWDGVYR
ncbi:MAG: flavin reductase family protein [Geminicoccaceae bacterium]